MIYIQSVYGRYRRFPGFPNSSHAFSLRLIPTKNTTVQLYCQIRQSQIPQQRSHPRKIRYRDRDSRNNTGNRSERLDLTDKTVLQIILKVHIRGESNWQRNRVCSSKRLGIVSRAPHA